MSRLKAALVGCGRIGFASEARVRGWPIAPFYLPYSHAHAIAASPGLEFVAACDADAALAGAVANEFKVAAHTSLAELLKTHRPDVLCVATRTPSRPGILAEALEGGVRGFYCEKPIANSLEDTDELARKFEQHRARFVYGTKRRFMPAYLQARRLVKEGLVGELRSITVHFGRGALFWAHPHTVDLCSMLMFDEPIEEVTARCADVRLESPNVIESDPAIEFASLRFKSGVIATIEQGEGQDVVLHGTNGRLTVESDGVALSHRAKAGASDLGWLLENRRIDVEQGATGTVAGLEALCRTVHGGPPEFSFAQVVRNQEALFAMVESHLNDGRRVTLPLARRGLVIRAQTGGRPA